MSTGEPEKSATQKLNNNSASLNGNYPIVKVTRNSTQLLVRTLALGFVSVLSIKSIFDSIDSWNSKFYNPSTGEIIRTGEFFYIVMWVVLSLFAVLGFLWVLSLWRVNCYQLNCPACGQPLFFPTESKTYDCPTCTKRLVIVDGIIKATEDLNSATVTTSKREAEE